jgi:hypothetical protein
MTKFVIHADKENDMPWSALEFLDYWLKMKANSFHFSDFPQSLQTVPLQHLKLGYDRLLPHLLQFIIHQTFHTMCRRIVHKQRICGVRFQVLTAASMKITAFWDVAPCSLAEVYRRFLRAYCLNHHGPDDGRSKHL